MTSLPTPSEHCRQNWCREWDHEVDIDTLILLVKKRDAQIIARLSDLNEELCYCGPLHQETGTWCQVCEFRDRLEKELRGDQ